MKIQAMLDWSSDEKAAKVKEWTQSLFTLRLQKGAHGEYVAVPFHYAGVVNEFPTAPTDSFLVANAAYVAQATGSSDIGELLVDTGGRDIAAVAERVSDEGREAAARALWGRFGTY